MLNRLECHEFPLELMRKLTADVDEEDAVWCGWFAGEPADEEENELEKVDDDPAVSDRDLWASPSALPFRLSTLCCLPLSPV